MSTGRSPKLRDQFRCRDFTNHSNLQLFSSHLACFLDFRAVYTDED